MSSSSTFFVPRYNLTLYDNFDVTPEAVSKTPLPPFYHWIIDFFNSSSTFVDNDLLGWHYPTFIVFVLYSISWLILAAYLFIMAFHYKFFQSRRMRETALPYKRRFQVTTNELGVKHSAGMGH